MRFGTLSTLVIVIMVALVGGSDHETGIVVFLPSGPSVSASHQVKIVPATMHSWICVSWPVPMSLDMLEALWVL